MHNTCFRFLSDTDAVCREKLSHNGVWAVQRHSHHQSPIVVFEPYQLTCKRRRYLHLRE